MDQRRKPPGGLDVTGLSQGLMGELELEGVICVTTEVDYLPSSQKIRMHPNTRHSNVFIYETYTVIV